MLKKFMSTLGFFFPLSPLAERQMKNYDFRYPHKSSFLNIDLPSAVSRVASGKGVGHFFLGVVSLTVNFNALYWMCPSLSFTVGDYTRSPEKARDPVCACVTKCQQKVNIKKLKFFISFQASSASPNCHISSPSPHSLSLESPPWPGHPAVCSSDFLNLPEVVRVIENQGVVSKPERECVCKFCQGRKSRRESKSSATAACPARDTFRKRPPHSCLAKHAETQHLISQPKKQVSHVSD